MAHLNSRTAACLVTERRVTRQEAVMRLAASAPSPPAPAATHTGGGSAAAPFPAAGSWLTKRGERTLCIHTFDTDARASAAGLTKAFGLAARPAALGSGRGTAVECLLVRRLQLHVPEGRAAWR
jgi:hypothetical protein